MLMKLLAVCLVVILFAVYLFGISYNKEFKMSETFGVIYDILAIIIAFIVFVLARLVNGMYVFVERLVNGACVLADKFKNK